MSVATPDAEILGHYGAEDLGVYLEEMLDDGSFRATEEGIRVTCEDMYPATGEVEGKRFWSCETAFGREAWIGLTSADHVTPLPHVTNRIKD